MTYLGSPNVVALDFPGQAFLKATSAFTLANEADITSAVTLREQDAVVHDPTDPNLGTNPEREYKHYFTADFGSGVQRVYVTFSADGETGWTTPTLCQMGGNPGRKSEDPSILTSLASRGTVHRISSKLVIYVEDKETGAGNHPIYAYDSTDGIVWTQLSGNPVIPLGAASSWEETLVGSPIARWDGTNVIVAYEGVKGTLDTPATRESMGVAHGTTPNSLTKLAANPVWHADSEPLAGNSIVADTFYLSDDGTEIYLFAHDGNNQATNAYGDSVGTFRGRTSETNPLNWTLGDIVGFGSKVVTSVRNDMTLVGDRIVTQPVDDLTIRAYDLLDAGGWLATTVKAKVSGSLIDATIRARVSGAWFPPYPASYQDEVAADSPLYWWRMNETSGTSIAPTNGGVTGTLNGGAVPSADGVTFDGTNDYMATSTLGTFGSTELAGGTTFEFMLKTTTTALGSVYGTIDTGTGVLIYCTINSNETDVNTPDTHIAGLRRSAGGLTLAKFTHANLNDGNWHHVAITYQANTASGITAYVDGTAQSMTHTTTSSNTTFSDFDFPLHVGALNNRGTNIRYLVGTVKEFAIYGSLLSSARIGVHAAAAGV